MHDILIQPTSTTLYGDGSELPTLEISLGRTPQGIVLLVCDSDDLLVSASEVMNRLAARGYESVAAEVPPVGCRSVVDALLTRAAARGWTQEQTGLIGFGAGGLSVLDAAVRKSIGAAVSFSPTLRTYSGDSSAAASETVEAQVTTPWLGLFGAEDPAASADWVERLTSMLDRNSEIHTATVRYPGVGREFYRHGNDGAGYAAWYDSWQRTMEWLEARIAPRPTPLALQWREKRGHLV
ncbi:dienelactone hydrolase family protein [Prescottella agglutinans]|uniref:Carboxymethylenebutenolidase n=1 Tax=Prescottella agglutinans TaxID=1644129 RepID=A0ABT6MIL2_9NOCA|nr:dienelactone hydrolase family protein [Prescottella agglutinans]MDH6284158.1 carboxymethylenebutenolidase [Prescottella agglutinans]